MTSSPISSPSPGASPRPRRGTVLVVDDDASIRSLVRHALEGEGYAVLEAGDGAAALGALERPGGAEVDLVLLDLTMPVMDGHQFAAAYGAGGRRPGRTAASGSGGPGGAAAPVVVFTAEKGVEAAGHADEMKAVGFLTKPFDIEELLAVVARCARKPGAVHGAEADVGPAPAAPPMAQAARMEAKATGEELRRRHEVGRLRTHLDRLQQEMSEVRLGVSRVAEIEASRRLTRDEARWASQLRLESERLRLELQGLRAAFFEIKHAEG